MSIFERWSRRWPYAVLAIVLLAQVYAAGHSLGGSFYWDESVYADLGHHPLHTEFYSVGNQPFVRHPPFIALLHWLGQHLPGRPEITVRAMSLGFATFALLLLFLMFAHIQRPGLGLLTILVLSAAPERPVRGGLQRAAWTGSTSLPHFIRVGRRSLGNE